MIQPTTVIEFERLGRTDRPLPLHCPIELKAENLDQLAEAIYRYASQYVWSSNFEVTVDVEGLVLIEGGRFGRGLARQGGLKR